ncbi:MAG: nucleoside deaminase [Ferruginibacter sp.]|nr:nucleoside deaminase [Ferruginibacter sp.]
MNNHHKYMSRCHELAEVSKKEGESAVGCVIVKKGKIIGEGTEKSKQLKDITRHAEVVAILDALRNNHDLSQAILYTNVEPCILCSYAIRHYKIGEVVFEKHCGELGGTAPSFHLLTNQNIKSWGVPPVVTIID